MIGLYWYLYSHIKDDFFVRIFRLGLALVPLFWPQRDISDPDLGSCLGVISSALGHGCQRIIKILICFWVHYPRYISQSRHHHAVVTFFSLVSSVGPRTIAEKFFLLEFQGLNRTLPSHQPKREFILLRKYVYYPNESFPLMTGLPLTIPRY